MVVMATDPKTITGGKRLARPRDGAVTLRDRSPLYRGLNNSSYVDYERSDKVAGLINQTEKQSTTTATELAKERRENETNSHPSERLRDVKRQINELDTRDTSPSVQNAALTGGTAGMNNAVGTTETLPYQRPTVQTSTLTTPQAPQTTQTTKATQTSQSTTATPASLNTSHVSYGDNKKVDALKQQVGQQTKIESGATSGLTAARTSTVPPTSLDAGHAGHRDSQQIDNLKISNKHTAAPSYYEVQRFANQDKIRAGVGNALRFGIYKDTLLNASDKDFATLMKINPGDVENTKKLLSTSYEQIFNKLAQNNPYLRRAVDDPNYQIKNLNSKLVQEAADGYKDFAFNLDKSIVRNFSVHQQINRSREQNYSESELKFLQAVSELQKQNYNEDRYNDEYSKLVANYPDQKAVNKLLLNHAPDQKAIANNLAYKSWYGKTVFEQIDWLQRHAVAGAANFDDQGRIIVPNEYVKEYAHLNHTAKISPNTPKPKEPTTSPSAVVVVTKTDDQPTPKDSEESDHGISDYHSGYVDTYEDYTDETPFQESDYYSNAEYEQLLLPGYPAYNDYLYDDYVDSAVDEPSTPDGDYAYLPDDDFDPETEYEQLGIPDYFSGGDDAADDGEVLDYDLLSDTPEFDDYHEPAELPDQTSFFDEDSSAHQAPSVISEEPSRSFVPSAVTSSGSPPLQNIIPTSQTQESESPDNQRQSDESNPLVDKGKEILKKKIQETKPVQAAREKLYNSKPVQKFNNSKVGKLWQKVNGKPLLGPTPPPAAAAAGAAAPGATAAAAPGAASVAATTAPAAASLAATTGVTAAPVAAGAGGTAGAVAAGSNPVGWIILAVILVLILLLPVISVFSPSNNFGKSNDAGSPRGGGDVNLREQDCLIIKKTAAPNNYPVGSDGTISTTYTYTLQIASHCRSVTFNGTIEDKETIICNSEFPETCPAPDTAGSVDGEIANWSNYQRDLTEFVRPQLLTALGELVSNDDGADPTGNIFNGQTLSSGQSITFTINDVSVPAGNNFSQNNSLTIGYSQRFAGYLSSTITSFAGDTPSTTNGTTTYTTTDGRVVYYFGQFDDELKTLAKTYSKNRDYELDERGCGPTSLSMILASICPEMANLSNPSQHAISQVMSDATNVAFGWSGTDNNFSSTLQRLSGICPTNHQYFASDDVNDFRAQLISHLSQNHFVIVLLGKDRSLLPPEQRLIYQGDNAHYILLIDMQGEDVFHLNPGRRFNGYLPVDHILGEIVRGSIDDWKGFAVW